jgi:hypothetical protein
VYTDHCTLENFNTQKELSRRQARWMELMSQFDMSILYIIGEDNTIADVLSCLPDEATPVLDNNPISHVDNWSVWAKASLVNAVLMVDVDSEFLDTIKAGYHTDEFCKKVIAYLESTLGIREENGLWYIGSQLLIPSSGTCREDLFHLAHDTLGHFGADKAYMSLCD